MRIRFDLRVWDTGQMKWMALTFWDWLLHYKMVARVRIEFNYNQ